MTVSVYIDESGEAGISKVRTKDTPGAFPYFVLAAAVMPPAVCVSANSMLSSVEAEIKKNWNHATDLNHAQTVYWCREAVKNNLRFFSVVSNKSTLGSYSDQIKNDPDMFYNKCAVYLLERIGKYLVSKGLDFGTPTVVFEERNHNYDAMRRYIGKIKENPMHTEAKYLRVFNQFAILAKAKAEEPLLKYADLAAHAVYQCANKSGSNYFIPEPRYLEELSAKFGADEKGKIIGNGIKCIHSLEELALDKDVEAKLLRMRAMPMQKVT